jgi:hypothetical protein
MMRTRGPRGVDTRIMEVLLDIVNDLADILRRNVGILSPPRGGQIVHVLLLVGLMLLLLSFAKAHDASTRRQGPGSNT